MRVANNKLRILYLSLQYVDLHVAWPGQPVAFCACGRHHILLSIDNCMFYQKPSIAHNMASVHRTFSVAVDTLHIPAEILYLT